MNIRKATLVALLCLFVCACVDRRVHTVPYLNRTSRGLLTGAATGAVVGSLGGIGIPIGTAIGGIAGTIVSYDYGLTKTTKENLEQMIAYYGISIMRLGEERKIIIPSQRLFYADSPKLVLPQAGQVLAMVMRYMGYHHTVGLTIAVYTDDRHTETRNSALTQTRALEVMHFLERHGVKLPVMFALGEGSAYPIANNQTEDGRSMNNRVEVSFRIAVPEREEALDGTG